MQCGHDINNASRKGCPAEWRHLQLSDTCAMEFELI